MMAKLPDNNSIRVTPERPVVLAGLDQSPEKADPPKRGSPKRKEHNALTHEQFFKAAQALIEDKARFLQEKPIARVAAEWLTTMCKFPISENSIRQLRKATGVDWQPEQKMIQGGGEGNRSRKLARVVILALRRLGATDNDMPELLELYELWNKGSNATEEQP